MSNHTVSDNVAYYKTNSDGTATIKNSWYPFENEWYPNDYTTNVSITSTVSIGEKVLYTGGTFDLFHHGHVRFLKMCKQIVGETGRVIVSLNTDDFIQSYKSVSPVFSYAEREEILDACRYVDDVIPNSGGHDSKPVILQVAPDFIAIGSDWAKKDYYKQMGFTQEWLDEYNIVLIYLPYTEGISSTKLRGFGPGQL